MAARTSPATGMPPPLFRKRCDAIPESDAPRHLTWPCRWLGGRSRLHTCSSSSIREGSGSTPVSLIAYGSGESLQAPARIFHHEKGPMLRDMRQLGVVTSPHVMAGSGGDHRPRHESWSPACVHHLRPPQFPTALSLQCLFCRMLARTPIVNHHRVALTQAASRSRGPMSCCAPNGAAKHPPAVAG